MARNYTITGYDILGEGAISPSTPLLRAQLQCACNGPLHGLIEQDNSALPHAAQNDKDLGIS